MIHCPENNACFAVRRNDRNDGYGFYQNDQYISPSSQKTPESSRKVKMKILWGKVTQVLQCFCYLFLPGAKGEAKFGTRHLPGSAVRGGYEKLKVARCQAILPGARFGTWHPI